MAVGLIGYWLGPYVGIVLAEHLVFRRTWSNYDTHASWDKREHPNLARGWAAIVTFLTSVVPIVLCMEQTWWTGPVAAAGTGDIAMIASFVYSFAVFTLTRSLELRWSRRTNV